MKLEVLVSCMNQDNLSIIKKSQITSDTLIINQTDSESYFIFQDNNQVVRKFNTLERGLSRSRNMALKHATGDICLICDDDEILDAHYEQIIIQAFECLPKADIIAFDLKNKVTRLIPKTQKVGRLKSLRLASYQLAIRRQRILSAGVCFDPFMGAGSGNGAGEENKFLLDCMRNGLRVYYVPETIGEVCHGSSTWFFGYDESFFIQRGSSTRYMLGLFPSILYGIYYLVTKRKLYQGTISTPKASVALFRGIWQNNIKKATLRRS